MDKFREKLCDRMIRLYGFENEITIAFAQACEAKDGKAFSDDLLETIVEAHEKYPAILEDD